jgi:hypothetical protein
LGRESGAARNRCLQLKPGIAPTPTVSLMGKNMAPNDLKASGNQNASNNVSGGRLPTSLSSVTEAQVIVVHENMVHHLADVHHEVLICDDSYCKKIPIWMKQA